MGSCRGRAGRDYSGGTEGVPSALESQSPEEVRPEGGGPREVGTRVCLCDTGPGSKRLGIDDDREAVPLTLQIIYSKVSEASAGPLPSQGLLLRLPHPPEPGPRADSSVLRPSSRPLPQIYPGTERWSFSIWVLPRHQVLGPWTKASGHTAFQGAISGRSRWSNLEKVCTSVNLSKACQKPEELGEQAEEDGWGMWLGSPEPTLSLPSPPDSSMDTLTLTLTEVVKRQNPKSKKGFNQVRIGFSRLPPTAQAGVGRACMMS